MTLILKAAQFADVAHAGQRRKFTGYPYITHPLRVAGRASLIYDVTEPVVAAAWLHDTIEDCRVTPEGLLRAGFPQQTVDLVLELTNPSKDRPDLGRAARKQLDREHIAKGSYWARVLKFLDRIDNLGEISPCDGFTKLYCEETHLLVDALAPVCPEPIFGGLLEDLDNELQRLSYPELLDDFSD
jgi:guanosine-3',5'-bis(diphosphate) 3'-pyrophosphohydrolase